MTVTVEAERRHKHGCPACRSERCRCPSCRGDGFVVVTTRPSEDPDSPYEEMGPCPDCPLVVTSLEPA